MWGEVTKPITGFEDSEFLKFNGGTSSNSNTDARTGESCSYFKHTSYKYAPFPALTSGSYKHIILWIKGETTADLATSSISSTSTPLDKSKYTRFYKTANSSSVTYRLYVTTGPVYIDDVVLYTDNNADVDLTAPSSATNLSASATELTWTNGSDALTGVQATLVFYNSNPNAIGLTLNDQGMYSLTSTIGPNYDQTGKWELLAENVAASATSYSGSFSEGTYAVVHRDLAYNYSIPAYVTLGAACVPPTITTHPQDATYSQGALATALTVEASGTSLTYQWQESSDNSNWTNIANEITTSYTPSTSVTGTKYYRCVVTESNDCSTNSNAATITVNAATSFTAGQTIFARSSGKGAWDADACVKAEFSDNSWGNKKEVAMVWLYNVGDITYKMFYFIVPSDNTYNHVQLNRYDPDGCTSKWNTVEWFGVDGSKNTIHSTTASSSNQGSWYSTNYEMYLKSSMDWTPNWATFTDQLNGNFAATINNITPTATSYEFRVYDINGQAFGNSNTTLSGLIIGSTYNITASFNIGSRGTLNLGKEFVKGTVSFNANGHGTAPAQLTDVPANSKLTEPEVGEVLGYTLEGWYKEAGCTNKWNFETDVVTESMTLYAHWVPTQYTITYNGLEGASNPNNPTTYTIESATITFQAPGTRTGYNFASWSPASIPAGSTGDKSTTASWTPKTTIITLDANTDNHGKTASSVTATYGQSLPSFTACTTDETGYSLTGYWTGAVGGTKVIEAAGTLVANVSDYTDADGKWQREDANLTLYAQYTIHTCDEYWLFTGETRDNTHFGGKTVGYDGNLGKGVVYPDGKSFQYGMYIAGATTLQSQSAYWQSYKPTNEQVNITVYAYTSTAQDVAIFIGNSTADAVEVKRENVAANTATIVKYSTSNFEIGKTIYVQWMNSWAVFGNIYVEDCVPAPADPWAVYGNFDGSYKAYLIENGTRIINSLAKETEYEFKITKNNDATIWYTDKYQNTMTEDNCTAWDFDQEQGANTKILTAAAGDYTFIVNTEGDFPVVSVVYPTSYTVSFVANGGTGTMNPVKHFAPNDSYTIPDCGFTYANMHFTGWKDQNDNNLAVGEQVTITSHLILTAQWEKAVTGLSITAPDNINEIEVGQTLQLTAHITPADATYGTEITWTSSNTTFLTVDETGLVTARAQGVGYYITATSSNGKTAQYYITVTSGSCENVWQVHMWNGSASTNTSHCMHQVGTTTEWRTDPVVLPSASDAEKLKVLYNNAEADKSTEWQTNWVPFIGHQYEESPAGTQYYPGENTIGYFRIYSDDLNHENYYLAFQPTYRVTMGITNEDGWVAYNFAQVNDSHEYETELVQVPSNYKSLNYYVGTLHSNGSSTNFIQKYDDHKSESQSLSGINGLNGQERAGQYGKYHIYDNSKAKNWYCEFKLYWTYELRDDDENVIYVAPGCEANVGSTTTLYNENLPTKTGYQQIGWSRTKGGSKDFDLGASYTYSMPVDILYPVWQANSYNITLAVGEHGTSAGSATATYDATALTAFNAVTPAAGYTVTGYYSDETKVLNADGTFAATNIDGFITSGKWTKAENCTLTAHYSISTTTITIDSNGGTVGSTSVTATYGQPLPSFDPCQAPQTKILVGYTVGGNLIINRDGTLVPSTDYADANGKWTFTGSALTVLASYRDAEEICKTFCTGGDISANGTYIYNDFTVKTNITSFNDNRGTLENGKYIIITNPNGFSPTTCAIWANAYGNKYAFKYTYSPNIDGSESSYGTTTLDPVDLYLAYYITLPAGTKYIKFERVSSNISVQNICIAETGYISTITVGANDVRELPNQVDNLIIYEGGQVTNETLTINKSLSYKRTIPGTDIWATISLPFDAYQILVYDQGDNRDYPIYPAYGENGKGEIPGYFFMKELTQSTEENFQKSWTHIKTQWPKANTPYIVSFPQVFDEGYFTKNTHITYEWRTTNSVPSITINRIEIPSGWYYSEEDGREFKLCANPNLMGIWLGEGTTAYLLTDDGTCFDRVDEPVIPPFSAYVIATQDFIAKCPRIMLVGGGSTPTDLVPIYSSPDVRADNRKVLIQGQIYIYRAGQVFDLTGHTIY